AGTHTAALSKDSLPVPLRQSQKRDTRRRRPGNQPPLASTAQPLSGELDVCERLPDHTGARCLRCSPHDRRSRLRARFTGADLNLRRPVLFYEEPHGPDAKGRNKETASKVFSTSTVLEKTPIPFKVYRWHFLHAAPMPAALSPA